MATAHQIQLTASVRGFVNTYEKLSPQSVDTTNALLMENHKRHHLYFDEAGLHNHIVHHLLCIYALGASPAAIQKAYENNTAYQLPTTAADPEIAETLQDTEKFVKHLGQSRYYRDYVNFFRNQIAEQGVEAVVNKYLFQGDKRADDLLGRMFSGFLHPIIHLGYGLEFGQPLIVAEALAQAAVHPDWTLPFLWGAEAVARSSSNGANRTLVEIMDEIRANAKLASSVEWSDPQNKITDGLFKRAAGEIIKVAAQWRVSPGKLQEKAAEMINAGLYMTATAQRPDKAIRFDFFLMHCANASYFFSIFNQMSWIPTASKARMVECMGRIHLLMYAAAKAPELRSQDVSDYRPARPGGWESIYSRVVTYEDDGHTAKLIRAIKNGEIVTRGFEHQPGIRLKEANFIDIAHMVMDSVEAMDRAEGADTGKTGYDHAADLDPFVQRVVLRWLRWAGFPEAWAGVGPRAWGLGE